MPEGKDEFGKADHADEQSNQPELNGPGVPPVPPQNPSHGNAEQDDADSNPNGATAVRRELHWLEILNFCGQIVLAIVGIVAACIYGRQLGVMKGQLDEIIKQYPEIKKQAQAATDAVTNGERQTRLDERPWLKFRFGTGDISSPTIQFSTGNPIFVPVGFVNVGKTPALEAHGMVVLQIPAKGKDPDVPNDKQGIALAGRQIPQGNHFIKQITGMQLEESIIFPNDHTEFSISRTQTLKSGDVVPRAISLAEYDQLRTNEAYISVWGQVWYSDVFGVEHWTKFCSVHGVAFQPESEKCVKYGDVDKSDSRPAKPTNK